MNFDELYNRVFINEQDNSEVADPADFDDVEPMPLPPTDLATDGEGGEEPSAPVDTVSQTSTSLTDYITQIEDFANKLNSTDGSSLNSLVSRLDKIETPFEGIYSRTSADIVDAAKTLRSVSEKLKNFIIHAAKK
jgi:hypothetical protein